MVRITHKVEHPMGLIGVDKNDQKYTSWQLKTAEYIARNREVGRRGVLFLLFFIDLLIISALVYTYVMYVTGIPAHQSLEDSLNRTYVNIQEYHATHRALPLEIVETAVVPTGTGRSDVVAWVRNPNRNWAVREVSYQFVAEGKRSPRQTTFLLPYETRMIAVFRHPMGQGSAVRVEFGQIVWQRIDRTRLLKLEGLTADEFRFTSFANGATGLDFFVKNTTPYSFWSVSLTIVARDAARVAGIQRVVVERWASGERRAISVSWPETLSRVSDTVVDFAVNILDPSEFMPLEGTSAPYPGF